MDKIFITASGIISPADHFDAEQILGKKGLRIFDRSTRLLMAATELLNQNSKLRIGNRNTYYLENRTALIVATMFGSIKSIFDFDKECIVDPQFVNPMLFPNTVTNAPAGYSCIRNNIKAFSLTLSHGFVAGLDAVGMAKEYLNNGYADVIYAGGVEEYCEHLQYGFDKAYELNIIQTNKVSEGAAVFSIEKETEIIKRNANRLAEIVSYDSFKFSKFDSNELKKFVLENHIEKIIYYIPASKIKLSDLFDGMDTDKLINLYSFYTQAYSIDGLNALALAFSSQQFLDIKNILLVGINPNWQISYLFIRKN